MHSMRQGQRRGTSPSQAVTVKTAEGTSSMWETEGPSFSHDQQANDSSEEKQNRYNLNKMSTVYAWMIGENDLNPLIDWKKEITIAELNGAIAFLEPEQKKFTNAARLSNFGKGKETVAPELETPFAKLLSTGNADEFLSFMQQCHETMKAGEAQSLLSLAWGYLEATEPNAPRANHLSVMVALESITASLRDEENIAGIIPLLEAHAFNSIQLAAWFVFLVRKGVTVEKIINSKTFIPF